MNKIQLVDLEDREEKKSLVKPTLHDLFLPTCLTRHYLSNTCSSTLSLGFCPMFYGNLENSYLSYEFC